MLALSDEPIAKVAPYVESHGLPFLVAAGSTTGGALAKMTGSGSLPHSFLIDPEGNLVWHGHPGSLSDKVIARALRGAERLGPKAVLAWRGEVPGAPTKALEHAAGGELKDALDELAEASTDGARDLRTRLEAHVADLRTQIDGAFERRDVRRGLTALEQLADELRGHDLGDEVAARLNEVERDKDVRHELDALAALDRALENGRRRGMKKARKSLESIVAKFTGTRAAERAAKILKGI